MADRLSFEKDGFAILPNSLSPPQIGMLIDCVSQLGGFGVRSRSGVYAVRNLLDVSCEVRLLASSPAIMKIVGQFFAADAFPVRGILFDKVHGANWLVPWHQDLTIAVRERIDTPGYGPWSVKAGVWHVQPPTSILDAMISVRIHLDDCDEGNGPLRVLPGTHRIGRLKTEEIAREQNRNFPVSCTAKAGGVVLMKPLLIHASSPAIRAGHRRVIHIDYASLPLHGDLQWHRVKE